MQSEFESLKSDTERLPDGPDKKAMLAMLAQEARLDEQIGKDLVQYRARHLRSRISVMVIGLLLTSVPSYFVVTGILTGRIPNLFVKNVPYAHWGHDPYAFSFITAFFGLLAFAFLCMALGVVSFGRKKNTRPAIRSTADLERRIQQELAFLERDNKEFPIVTRIFGVETRSQRIPVWFAALVIGTFVAVIVRAIVRAA